MDEVLVGMTGKDGLGSAKVVGAVLARRRSHLWRVPQNARAIVHWGCGSNAINATSSCSSSRMTLSVTAPSLVTEPLT